MSGPGKFTFSLQPRLDQLKDEKTACQVALRGAREALRAEEATLEKCEVRGAELVQLLRAQPDNPGAGGPGPAYELIDQGRTFDAFTAQLDQLQGQIAQQRGKIELARGLVQEREQDLGRVLSDLQALERLLERQRAEWESEAARSQQAELDDAAIAAWVRRSRHNP